jgi:hypothetical protein
MYNFCIHVESDAAYYVVTFIQCYYKATGVHVHVASERIEAWGFVGLLLPVCLHVPDFFKNSLWIA